MIGMGRAVSRSGGHALHNLKYDNGESVNKKKPEKIFLIEERFLPPGLDAKGILDMMNIKCDLDKNTIQAFFSPSKKYTKGWTHKEWIGLYRDILKAADSVVIYDKDGKVASKPTNFSNSMSAAWLHLDSKSENPHMHCVICRSDINGNVNNDHQILRRLQKAAEIVARQRGWETAMERHNEIVDEINRDCMSILKDMPKWDLIDYVLRLKAKGYKVRLGTPDKTDGKIHGYSLQREDSDSRYIKASELGVGRNLTISKIENTWFKLHGRVLEDEETELDIKSVKPQARVADHPVINDTNRMSRFLKWSSGYSRYELPIEGKVHKFYLPDNVINALNQDVDYRFIANYANILNVAVALFVGYVDGATAITESCGGGTSCSQGWRDEPNEDDIERAHRCAQFAKSVIGVQKRRGLRR